MASLWTHITYEIRNDDYYSLLAVKKNVLIVGVQDPLNMVDALVGFNAKLSKNRIHLNETIITKLNISKQCRNNGVYSMQQKGAMNICEFLRS